jgi:hypothetical protein
MGSEISTTQIDTRTTNTITYNTTNNYSNDIYHINITVPQISHHREQNALVHDISERPVLTHSFPEQTNILQENNYDNESEYMISVSLDNERENSTVNKKKYLQSAVLNCSHTPVRSNDVRQIFERNKWEFKEDDFNDICNNLFTICNLKQRLDTIETIRICLEENIKLKLTNNHLDVNIFLDFADVIE